MTLMVEAQSGTTYRDPRALLNAVRPHVKECTYNVLESPGSVGLDLWEREIALLMRDNVMVRDMAERILGNAVAYLITAMEHPTVHLGVGAPARCAGPGCALCATPGDFGPYDPANPHSGLCPACITAGRPTREGLESAVIIVAGQTLAEAESVELTTAAPEELTYHLGAVKRSLRSVLQLFAPVEAKGAR